MTYRLHLHYLSSYCWKTTIAFYEAGVPFEAVEVNLGDPAGRAELQRISPLVKIPALEDRARGAVVNETSVIIEYLAIYEPSARQLVPADAKAALPVRYYDRFFDNYVQGPMNRVVANEIRPPDAQRDPFGVEQARAELIRSYDVLEAKLPRQGFATGDAFTLADCAACPALFYANYVAPYEATHPNLWAYFKRLEARPSFARALKEKEPVFHYFPLNKR